MPLPLPQTKHRNRTEIVIEILKAVHNHQNITANGITATQLMYTTFLSFNKLKEYLTLLIENVLLESNMVERKYKITEEGLELIDIYEKMADMIAKSTSRQYYQQQQFRH